MGIPIKGMVEAVICHSCKKLMDPKEGAVIWVTGCIKRENRVILGIDNGKDICTTAYCHKCCSSAIMKSAGLTLRTTTVPQEI